MSGRPGHLDELASRVSDGADVDWDGAERSATSDEERAMIARLRLVEGVARFHRGLGLGAAATGRDVATPESPPALFTWGRLEAREKLGEGGFGKVYRAWDPDLEREVALKLIEPTGRGEASLRHEAVLAEGRLMARVRHPNVIAVHGAEQHEGRLGLWMELVSGRTLSDLLREQGRLGAREAALIGIDLARALAAVHGAGLVHRDVKAHNVMRESGGRIVLMDFGAGAETAALARGTTRISGTPLYIAPEVLAGAPPTPRSDLYSLGVLLHHLVTGDYPVQAGSFAELVEKHRRGERQLLRDARPDLPPGFLNAVELATEADPVRRFASAGHLERALTAVLGSAEAADRVEPAPPNPRRWPRILALGVAAAALPLALWLAAGREAPPPAVSGVTAPYTLQVTLYRVGPGGDRERLDSGSRVELGERLTLEIRGSRPLYVYVFNEDARGHAAALFPLSGLDLRNPLDPETTHLLPGRREGKPIGWQVTTAGAREFFVVVASPQPLVEFEAELARLTQPSPGALGVALDPPARVLLRGIGGVAELPAPGGPGGSADRLFEMARTVAAGSEKVEGVFVRQIELIGPEP